MPVSDESWRRYQRDGYLRIGRVVDDEELAALQQRIDDIMLGRADIDYNQLLMQLDSETGEYGDAGAQTRGHKGATLNYRKIQDLELDPLFLEYMQRPLFRDLCARVYGPETPIGCFRAMFMNKPARRGTVLPWHQDRWKHLDRDPLLTVWLALDPATVENGCVEVIPGSHRRGLINPDHASGFLTDRQAVVECRDEDGVPVELAAGEAVALHNWLLHRSGVNRSDIPRRAFSVCYMDAKTIAANGASYRVIFGPGALQPSVMELA